MTMVDLNFYRFVEAWHCNLHGPKTAGDLVSYAEMFGVPIGGETPRAKETSLGKLISAHAGKVIEHNGFRLVVCRRMLKGKRRYQVHPG